MARFLLCTMPITGHVNPAYVIAQELVARGHAVMWYTGKKFRTKIEATGAQFAAMVAAYDWDDSDWNAAFPTRKTFTGLKQIKHDVNNVFLEPVAGQVEDIERILRDFPADVLLADTAFLGARIVHERGGPSYASYAFSSLALASRDVPPAGLGILPIYNGFGRLRNRFLTGLANTLLRAENARVQKLRVSLGLSPNGKHVFEQPISPYLNIQGGTDSFEYPRTDLSPTVHFVGPLLPPPPSQFNQPEWWSEVQAGRPVVLVTQGTVATDPEVLIQPTLRALATTDTLVIATTDPHKLAEVPHNARVQPFVPFTELMPYVSVMITNGGWGGVQTALAHGVPLIGAGTTEDKSEITNRIAWSGVGINLKTQTPTIAQIRTAVTEILTDPRYRTKAQQIKAEIAAHNPPAETADLLERLATTRQAVTR